MRCHYCGYGEAKLTICPECKSKDINFFGMGTEKLEQYIKDEIKDSKVIRMDQDTTSLKGAHERIINDFRQQKYNILIGTQMISKGLDFPLVTLVGVIQGDATLNLPDFRSGEKTIDLLMQVAGRAGRSERKGEVVIESYDPNNYYLKCVQNNSYEDFYKYELKLRKKFKYPPYYYLVNVKVSGKNLDKVFKESTNVYNYLKNNLLEETIIFNPTPSSIFRVNNTYTYQILIKYKYDGYLNIALKKLDEMYATNNSVDFTLDFNPSRF
jgi:primosomal protein N' (replication factor Y)